MTAQVFSPATSSMDATQNEVLAEVRNHIGHLTLNRPAGLNAMTLEMVRSLQRQLDAWAQDAQVHAVVLRGAGEKAFCAGGDIRSLYDSFKNGDTLHEDFFVEEYALDLAIHHYRKPVLALMDGFVLGGGMGLVQGADLRVVTEKSRLAMPEVAIGYFPDVGGSHFLPRVPGNWGSTSASAVCRSARPMRSIAAWPIGTLKQQTRHTRRATGSIAMARHTAQGPARPAGQACGAALPDAPLSALRWRTSSLWRSANKPCPLAHGQSRSFPRELGRYRHPEKEPFVTVSYATDLAHSCKLIPVASVERPSPKKQMQEVVSCAIRLLGLRAASYKYRQVHVRIIRSL